MRLRLPVYAACTHAGPHLKHPSRMLLPHLKQQLQQHPQARKATSSPTTTTTRSRKSSSSSRRLQLKTSEPCELTRCGSSVVAFPKLLHTNIAALARTCRRARHSVAPQPPHCPVFHAFTPECPLSRGLCAHAPHPISRAADPVCLL